MSAADWDEIRRLAADFQRAQLSSTIQRLSERNCIEIVNKLVDFKLIKVVYTQDGKEYVTPKHLAKDIKDELFVRAGRISLSDLQEVTNVDYSRVEAAVKEIVSADRQYQLVLGDLISPIYIHKLAQEINDLLHEQGHLTISELAKIHDLPGEFLSQIISKNMGRVIQAFVDNSNSDYLYTEAAILRHRATVRGLFSAVTRPTSLMSVRQRCDFPGDLFYSTLEKLVSSGRLKGSVFGGRSDRAMYNPDIYSRTQNEWVDAFLTQNGYLDYDALARLGISDPKGYIRRRYGNESLTFLSSCCAGRELFEQLEASVEDALAQNSWIDVMPLLPSAFSESDVSVLLGECLRKHPTAVVFSETVVFSESWLSECEKSFEALVTSKAEKDAISNPEKLVLETQKKSSKVIDDLAMKSKESKKEQRRKKAAVGGKSGGGTQGREVKTKATKKKYRSRQTDNDPDSDDDVAADGSRVTRDQVTVDDITLVLQKRDDLEEANEELLAELALYLQRPLSQLYHEKATSIILQSTGIGSGSDRRKTHEELQEKISGLWVNARLFQKGIKLFEGKDDVEDQLVKHLLKTVCTSIANHVTVAMATDHLLNIPNEQELSADSRQRLVSNLPTHAQSVLTRLMSTLSMKELEPFFESLDVACDAKHLGVLLRKPDRKKEKQLMTSHKESLLNQLTDEEDPAMTLHLVATLLFLSHTQTLLHAPGRSIPHVIGYLSRYLQPETQRLLLDLQELIVLHLKCADQSDDRERLVAEMKALLPRVKEIAFGSNKFRHNSESNDK